MKTWRLHDGRVGEQEWSVGCGMDSRRRRRRWRKGRVRLRGRSLRLWLRDGLCPVDKDKTQLVENTT